MTSKDNPYFAKSYVNRLWGYLFGVGIIEPLDDLRAGNPPSNPELLDYLTREFVKSGFDVRHVMRLVCKSRTYQLSVETNKWNADDKVNYAHATARRLPAEVLLDAVYRVTGSVSKFPGVAAGTRAAALPDSGVELPSGFLTTFGRPARESACECERSSGLQLGPIMALVSGPTLGDAIADPGNELTRLVKTQGDDIKLIDELFMRILNRPATAAEVETCRKDMQAVDDDHRRMAEELGKREMQFALNRPVLERQRQAAITAAQVATRRSTRKQQAPKLAEEQRKKAEATAKLEADLKAYETTVLAKKMADWEKEKASSIVNRWQVLEPKAMSATNRSTLHQRAGRLDRRLRPQQERCRDDLGRDRIDRDHRPAARGLDGQPPSQQGPWPGDRRQLRAQRARADARPPRPTRNRPNPSSSRTLWLISVRRASTSPRRSTAASNDPSNGWAVAPATGVVHWATFETSEPIGGAGGTVLTFKMHHRFGKRMDTRPVPSVGHPRRQTGRPQPAGRLPRDPGHRA